MNENATTAIPETSNGAIWTSRILAALITLIFAGSAAAKLSGNPDIAKKFTEELGFKPGVLQAIGILELLCVVTFAIPKTRFLGAVLLTGYLGGAICAHVRIGESVAPLVVIATMLWGSLFATDTRVRQLFLGLR